MSICIMNRAGDILVHRHMNAAPAPCLRAVAPDRDGLVVAVECRFTWAWLADLWAHAGSPFVLGQALSRKAIQGGQATPDTIDAQQIAARRRGGMCPQASGAPAEMRATRALLRRRTPLMRQRADLVAHVQPTHRPSNRPASGQTIAAKANRDGGADRWADPAVPKSLAVDWALLTDDDQRLTALARALVKPATHHGAHPCDRLRSVPGVGKMFARVMRYEIHAIQRCPRGQAIGSYWRLRKCAKEAAGTRDGPSGKNIGQAELPWACSEAAGRCVRHKPAGPKCLAT